MDDVLAQTLTSQRFSAFVLGLFASLALALASIGIYSVLWYIVRGGSREVGIRTALGARTGDVLRMVVLEGVTPTPVGIAGGGIAAVASAKLLEKLVFGVSASDPLTLGAVAGVLAIVALSRASCPPTERHGWIRAQCCAQIRNHAAVGSTTINAKAAKPAKKTEFLRSLRSLR